MLINCWRTSRGDEEVYDLIASLKDEKLKKKIYRTLEFIGGQTSLANCFRSGLIKSFENSRPQLYEIKVKEARILFCVKESCCWLLTLFIKNSQKTPLREIRKAEARAQSIIN